MKVTVAEYQTSTPYHGRHTPTTARLRASGNFLASDGTLIYGGRTRKNWYQEVAVTVDENGIVTIGAFSHSNKVETTNNNSYDNGFTYTLTLHDSKGSQIDDPLFENLRVPDTQDPTSWDAIETFSTSPQINTNTTHPLWSDVVNYIDNHAPMTQKANSTQYGIGKTRTIPDDLTDPILVGDNDTRLVKNLADYEDSLATAVSEIGSDEMVLSVTRPVTVGTVTVPKNVTLDVGATGLITVSSGQTLTIGSLRNPGNRKIFAGTGNVRFKEGAVDYANVAWFTGLPVAGTVDATYAINQINASFIANKGGVMFFPIGVFETSGGHILADNTLIKGAGNYPGTNFGTRIKLTSGSTFGFKIGEGEWSIHFQDLIIDGNNLSNVDGILCTGAYPNTSGNLSGRKVSILNCTHGVRIYSTSGSWQMAQVAFELSTFFNNSHSGIRCNTSNSTIKVDTCFFHIPVGGWAGYLENCGSLVAIGTEHAGMAGTLACSGGVPNAGMAEGGWHIGGFHAPLKFLGCSDEALRYFIVNNASDVQGIINIESCVVGSDILLNETCKVNSEGNFYLGKAFRDSVASASRITSKNDYFRPIDSCGNVIDAGIPSAFVGGSVIIVEENADAEELRYRLPAKFYQNETFFALPDEDAWMQLLSTRTDKRLFRLGRCDADGVFDFGYDFWRKTANGRLQILGNQALPNRGFDFNADITTTSMFVGGVVTPNQITSNQNNYNPGNSSQHIRLSTDASRNITGLAFDLAQVGGEIHYIYNVGSFNIVLQHNTTSTAGNRFLTNTGADITLLPGDIAFTQYDAVSTRWRVARIGNNPSIVDTGALVTINNPLTSTGQITGASFNTAGAITGATATLSGALAAASLNLGGGALLDVLTGTATLDFDLSSSASQDLTITVTGASVGDSVFLGVPHGSVTADTLFFGWVSASNTVTVRALRTSGTPNPASGTFRATVLKF